MTNAVDRQARLCQIRLRRRSHNLFVRLNPLTLEALVQDYYCQQQEQQQPLSSSTPKPDDSSWKLPEYIDLEKIEFLPLELRFVSLDEDQPDQVAYASFNGGLFQANHEGSPSGTFQTFIEIPEALLPFQAKQHTESDRQTVLWDTHQAHVRILPTIKDATQIMAEPLTSRDWKLLQAQATWLEQGAWLKQVSVVFSGQVIPVEIGPKKLKARVRILDDNGLNEDLSTTENDLDWPDEESSQSPTMTRCCRNDREEATRTGTSHYFVRLLADSEIVIVPKEDKGPRESDRLFSLCPSIQHYSPEMSRLAECLQSKGHDFRQMEEVPYGIARIHRKTMKLLVEENIIDEGPRENAYYARIEVKSRSSRGQEEQAQPLLNSIFVLLEASDVVGKNQVALHPLMCLSLHLSPWLRADKVTLTLITSLEAERRSMHVRDILSRGYAHLRMAPTRICGTNSRCLESIPQNSAVPVSIGSLFVAQDDSNQPIVCRLLLQSDENSTSEKSVGEDVMLTAKDLDFLRRSNALLPSIFEDPVSICAPTSPFLVFDLLPGKTVFPSKLLDNAVPRYMCNENVIIHGPSGSGKTSSALFVAAMWHLVLQNDCFHCTVAHFDCRKEKDSSKTLSDLMQRITDVFESAMRNRPCLVVLDDLDEICPNIPRNQSDSPQSSSSQVEQSSPAEIEQSRAVQNHLENLLMYKVPMVITCRTAESIAFPSSGRRKCFKLPLIQSDEKLQLLQVLVETRSLKKQYLHLDQKSLLEDGTTPIEFFLRDLIPKDLEILAARLLREANTRESGDFPEVLRATIDSYIPLNRRAAVEEPNDSFVDWTRVGGLFEAKKCLVDLVVRPMRFRRIYETSRIRLPRGILLYGPPGCGKTILPPSLAKFVGLPLIVCRGCEILDKYIGASEAKVRELFERAAQSAPSILFIDEIDSLAPQRGSDLTGVTDRVVNQLLTFLDGVEEVASGKTVYVMASSSRPDKIDAALLRPGRFEKHVCVGIPGSMEEVNDLIQKVGDLYPLELSLQKEIASRALDDQLLALNPNLLHCSPSDIKAIFDSAQISSVREFLEKSAAERGLAEKPMITKLHFLESFRSSRPALSSVERSRLDETYARFSGKMTTRPMEDEKQRVAVR